MKRSSSLATPRRTSAAPGSVMIRTRLNRLESRWAQRKRPETICLDEIVAEAQRLKKWLASQEHTAESAWAAGLATPAWCRCTSIEELAAAAVHVGEFRAERGAPQMSASVLGRPIADDGCRTSVLAHSGGNP